MESFLFYARAVNSTMLVTLSNIVEEQANSTKSTMQKCLQLLDYTTRQENVVVTYQASNMVITIHSDASYLSKPQACNQVGDHFSMSHNKTNPPDNVAVHTVAKIIIAVMSSAAEVELGAFFIIAKTAVPIYITLE